MGALLPPVSSLQVSKAIHIGVAPPRGHGVGASFPALNRGEVWEQDLVSADASHEIIVLPDVHLYLIFAALRNVKIVRVVVRLSGGSCSHAAAGGLLRSDGLELARHFRQRIKELQTLLRPKQRLRGLGLNVHLCHPTASKIRGLLVIPGVEARLEAPIGPAQHGASHAVMLGFSFGVLVCFHELRLGPVEVVIQLPWGRSGWRHARRFWRGSWRREQRGQAVRQVRR